MNSELGWDMMIAFYAQTCKTCVFRGAGSAHSHKDLGDRGLTAESQGTLPYRAL